MFGLGRREFGNPKNTVESLLYKLQPKQRYSVRKKEFTEDLGEFP